MGDPLEKIMPNVEFSGAHKLEKTADLPLKFTV